MELEGLRVSDLCCVANCSISEETGIKKLYFVCRECGIAHAFVFTSVFVNVVNADFMAFTR